MDSEPPQHSAHQRAVENLAWKLRRRQLVGSRATALETLLVLRQVISKSRFSNLEQLVAIVRGVGRRLVEAQPKEHSVGNTVRKVLHHIREEYNTATGGATAGASSSGGGFSISRFVALGQPRKQTTVLKTESKSTIKEDDPDDPDAFARSLKPVLMEAIQDVLDELETVYDNVGKNAQNHIHSDEIIMTLGMSKTVESFLISASHHRNYTVMVLETAPSYAGRDMSKALSEAGISTFLVPDSSIYGLMSRVNKVILGTHAILANGGMFAVTGSMLVATAAHVHSTPVMVCAGQFKLTPLWNLYHQYGALDFGDPSQVLGFENGALLDKVDVVNPFYDYVPPNLVDAYITNDGDHPPTSIYRLIKETYDDEDYEL
ncbi:Translation initiation factor eIF-2B subunit beta [Mycena chlorophos]|uniref:Translation initiation factor eIF2B subunit beta n=1 Tax=Mycena chlorophos TaxID=658473 RepID=A0A8H6WPS3_MYCCL|nr:Translation initiation factor eIF-2B subunit beta [Mycena chlorophos]